MDIDTLIFSGGSVKGISFLGSIKYLIAPEDRIVSPIKFEQINKIFTGISLQFYNLYIYLIV